jgi:hypothetical protein
VGLHWVKGVRSRRWIVALLIALCAAGGAVARAIAGGTATQSKITTAGPATFRADLIAHLRARHLTYRWVVCVPTNHHFRGVRVVRCNVDFGEPHIEAYCSVLRGGQLLTNQEDPAIPCGHDNSGFSDPVVQFG